MNTVTAASRAAGIDVGSNTFLLAILERGATGDKVVSDRCDITKLGEGVDASGRLSEAAMERCLAMLVGYREQCRREQVTAIRAVGTAALRDAANRDDFLHRVEAATGIRVEVITGDREAELTYADVALTHGQAGEDLSLLDIGGGSTELVTGRDGAIRSRRSINLGSRRLAERAKPGDPPGPADLARCRAVADELLAGAEPVGGRVVGTGGTITTLVAVDLALAVYDSGRVSAARLTPEDVTALIDRLSAMPAAERATLPGLDPKRADIIVTGAVILERLMVVNRLPEVRVSAGGLRMAVARQALAAAGS